MIRRCASIVVALLSSSCGGEAAPPHCGDGIRNYGEECDARGEDVFRCDADCTLPLCGDGYVNTVVGEVCDDGNTDDGDECAPSCARVTVCGDGDVDSGEACDDGNTIDGDGCPPDCREVFVCGDGRVEDEACDDGNSGGGLGSCSSVGPRDGLPVALLLCALRSRRRRVASMRPCSEPA